MSAPSQGRSVGTWLAIVATVVVIATIAAAIRTMGTPGQQRQVKLDDRRVEDLDRLDDSIREHFKVAERLPENLDVVAHQPGTRLSTTDPVTKKPYEFTATGERTFELCAEFATDTAETPSRNWRAKDWKHGRGRQCFNRTIELPKP